MKFSLKFLIGRLPAGWQNALYNNTLYRTAALRMRNRRFLRYDQQQFCRHAGMLNMERRGSMQAQIVKTYHRLEKGLALAQPKPGFGGEVAAALSAKVDGYVARHGADVCTLRALETVEEHIAYNDGVGHPNPPEREFAHRQRALHGPAEHAGGGTRKVTREEIHAAARIDFGAFTSCRHSVRHFGKDPVYDADIRAAIEMAQRAPSVCNRQAGHAYVVRDREKIARLLKYQSGNAGFGEQTSRLLVVAARYDCFLSPEERNQCWIDGGLFAMSLVYALHSRGLGTCCLNWCVDPKTDHAFKVSAGIPESNAVIMLLAVGSLPDTFLVANSARRPIDEVMVDL
jgi:nitroreductase